MLFTRREFLATSLIFTAGTLLPIHKIFSLEEGKWQTIRDNIGVYTNKGGTIGWYINDIDSIVIDTQFPDSAADFLEMFKKKHNKKIDVLFNTHHHPDHVSGNSTIKQFANKHIAHEDCVKFSQTIYKGTDNEKNVSPAETTFSKDYQHKLKSDKIIATHFGKAHTAGDITIHFEKENVAHIGDLVFNGVYPFIDTKGGGGIKGWIEVLEKVSKHFDKDTTFIYGHGATDEMVVGKHQDLISMRDYFNQLLDFVSKNKTKFQNKDEIEKAEPFNKERKQQMPGIFQKNIGAALLEV